MSAEKPDPPPWRLFAVIVTASFMALLDTSIVNVALPTLSRELGANPTHEQWIVAGYSLSFALALAAAGRAADVYGRKRMFLVGASGFGLVSLLCGLSLTPAMLIVLRLVQGMTGAILIPTVSGFIQQLFTGPPRARAFGYLGMVVGVSTAVGPVLGGFLVSALPEQLGWRSIFFINVPIAAIIVPLAARRLPADNREARTSLRLDVPGILLVSISTIAIMLPFVLATSRARVSDAPWWLLVVAVVGIVVFVVWERREDAVGHSVVAPGELVRTQSYVYGTVIGMLYFLGFAGFFLSLALYLQAGLGMPAWQAGLTQMPFAIGSATAAARAGRWVNKWGRRLVTTSLAGALVGFLSVDAMTNLHPDSVNPWLLGALLLVTGAFSGAVITPNVALTLEQVPAMRSSTAAALQQTMQRIGATISITAMTLAFYASLPALARRGDHVAGIANATYSGAFSMSLHITEFSFLAAITVAVLDGRRRSHQQARA
ncbi:drug resistance transporter, EmrB/QacA subfamily [Raineyella antarctica]|uniref:Drug resistance transporter, EmrB/QacA subfamily n=1 Tax=Raineyella antarctica TaxID=1577474 RepID=A0A1G6GP40_9ACTN|nr:MFS transporter [Raineyella antarctica]SDB83525.1 drug resistance transporter, EmrB/QacA subfamily [Raineyella antarctica]